MLLTSADKYYRMISMTKRNNTIRRNEMKERIIDALAEVIIIGAGIVSVIMCAIVCSWILLSQI